MSAVATLRQAACGANEALEQPLPFAPGFDDFLRLALVDLLIVECPSDIAGNTANVCLQVKRGFDQTHRVGIR